VYVAVGLTAGDVDYGEQGFADSSQMSVVEGWAVLGVSRGLGGVKTLTINGDQAVVRRGP